MKAQIRRGVKPLFSWGMLLSMSISLVALVLVFLPMPAHAQSGQVWLVQGKIDIEPAYNDLDGSLMYLLTPSDAPASDPSNMNAQAPLYIIVYPRSSANYLSTPLNCQHYPMDNCPGHGPGIAGLAESMEPSVYGKLNDGSTGVLGHDHIGGAPPTGHGGTDYNVAWLPVVILFKTAAAAETHITTLAQLQTAMDADSVKIIPLYSAVFQCSSVSATVYENGAPVGSVPPIP